ncbi:HAD-like domain-containing protein [Ochromonadaceae sp. CCMP2298]|nr:HAD-like domain-containing protein [Ochromonadaceae sp. CCMP2298]
MRLTTVLQLLALSCAAMGTGARGSGGAGNALLSSLLGGTSAGRGVSSASALAASPPSPSAGTVSTSLAGVALNNTFDSGTTSTPNPTPTSSSALRKLIRESEIKCVLSDIDGTFLTDQHSVSSSQIEAVREVMQRGLLFFPATGRTRKSVMDATDGLLSSLFNCPLDQVPGVYSQGLMVYGTGGRLIHEEFLPSSVVGEVESFCAAEQVALIAYAGDTIYARGQCAQTRKITAYKEPVPLLFPAGLGALEASGVRANKLILLAEEAILEAIRPKLALFLGTNAALTKAVPGMLEVLPYGASKGSGVERLLAHYGVQAGQTMAFGDGENDIEMMQGVGLSVAMENAKPRLKEVSHALTLNNNEGGVGHALRILLEEMSVKEVEVGVEME